MTAQTARAEASREGQPSSYDRFIDALCMLGMGAVFLHLAVLWPTLPDYIPTRVSTLTSVDTKSILLPLPILAVLTYALLTLLRPTVAAIPLWRQAEHNRLPIQNAAGSLLSTIKFWGIVLLLIPAVDRISIAATGRPTFHALICPLAATCLGIFILNGVRRIRRLQLELPPNAALEPGETAAPLEEPAAPQETHSEEN